MGRNTSSPRGVPLYPERSLGTNAIPIPVHPGHGMRLHRVDIRTGTDGDTLKNRAETNPTPLGKKIENLTSEGIS